MYFDYEYFQQFFDKPIKIAEMSRIDKEALILLRIEFLASLIATCALILRDVKSEKVWARTQQYLAFTAMPLLGKLMYAKEYPKSIYERLMIEGQVW